MKKLLALLLLTPLASANWNGSTNTLDLERLGQWLPDDSYVGLICDNEVATHEGTTSYRMLSFSLKDMRGINLLAYWHSKAYADLEPGFWGMNKNERWGELEVTDYRIKIKNPGSYTLNRETLYFLGGSCKIASKEEMKEFGYKVEKLYQEHQKIIKDTIEKRLNKRKL